MKLKSVLFLASCIVFVSCSEPQARRPITAKTSTTLASTVAQTKVINKIEEQAILKYIESDSIHKYTVSSNGFWYTYNHKIEAETYTPKANDRVLISYDIKDLNNEVIYSSEELGQKQYVVDKEDFITALQIGIKMMKEGESVTFVIPSFNAYGVVGDGNRIGINESIISTVTLLKINQTNRNEN
ncbi:gliding motility-associated peptidyl-prolyl isomerase GldI [Flavobacteriaceae bacterium S356]|uniref:Peptidyl-prolyl cis-trans isomerase n=1 Tax=Asprobacillus argus TaxID=3076534 RepID=A0ABU3LEI3_9FLAO|nr:gliding motility-associated peptidyl-prolyl isomerase GldI [Flavobacteriaceae bacterium S356]